MASSTAGVDVEALAERLALATSDKQPIPKLTIEEPDLDVVDAYRIQRIGIDNRVAAGETVIGYKLGLVSRAKQEAMGVAEPLWGWLTDGMCHEEEAPLDVSGLIHPRAEPELAFLLRDDVDARTATAPTVLRATAGVFPALEVLDSRYEKFQFTLPDVIADNGSAARIVLGGRLVSPMDFDVQREGMVLRCDGEVVDTAAGAAIAGNPAAVVAWLARVAGGLPAGSIVLSGGLTAPVRLAPGTVVSAEYTTLGSVSLRCAS